MQKKDTNGETTKLRIALPNASFQTKSMFCSVSIVTLRLIPIYFRFSVALIVATTWTTDTSQATVGYQKEYAGNYRQHGSNNTHPK